MRIALDKACRAEDGVSKMAAMAELEDGGTGGRKGYFFE